MASFVLDIAPQGDTFKLAWTIVKDEPWTPEAYGVDAGQLKQAAANVRTQLRQIALMRDKGSSDEFALLLKRLAQYGQTLFLRLLPEGEEMAETRQQLEAALKPELEGTAKGPEPGASQAPTRPRSDLKIRLATDELFIPWGFVFAGRREDLPAVPQLSIADMKGFWLAMFRISVVYGGDASLPRERKTQNCRLFALHEHLFELAVTELEKEDKTSAERLDILLHGDPAPAMDWETFEEEWSRVRDDRDSVLYVFGHSDGQHVQLKDVDDDPKWVLSTSDMIRFRKMKKGTASIFVLNGCRTGAPSPQSQEVPISANFLKETRKSGYYGFIGTETVVSNIVACRYGTGLLWRLCIEGKSVGEAFDELLSDKDLFPHNTLYTCFADRKFRFVMPPPEGNGS